jgi:superfamily II DNA helicase RecQ
MQKTMVDRILELRLKEIDLQNEIVECLRNLDATGDWRNTGAKTLRDFCVKELGWSQDTIRTMMIALGKILPTEKLVAKNPAATARLHALIKWRAEKRIESGVAAYQILTNRTILEIADQNPLSIGQLQEIPGVGPKKLTQFGEDVLRVLNHVNC